MVDIVERVVDMELQLGATAQLVARLLGEFVADAALTLVDVLHDGLCILAGENTQAYVSHAQVGRDAHAAHRDKRAACLGGLAAEYLTQFLLHQAADFLLSCCIHYCLIFYCFAAAKVQLFLENLVILVDLENLE